MTGMVDRLRHAARPGGRVRRLAPVIGLAAVLLVLSVVLARPAPTGLPLDPRSSDADGTKALTLVLDRLGADVEILDDVRGFDTDVVLVLSDHLDALTAQRLRDHAAAGAVLVVTDPGGSLSPDARLAGTANAGLLDAVLRRGCEIPALADADQVRVGLSSVMEVPDGATGCYQREQFAWLVVEPLGSGTVATTGGPGWLTNALLGEADNAVLAAALLAPAPGTRVGILPPDFVAQAAASPRRGETSLGDLIPLALRSAALQLVVAFLVFVLWRSRRLGKPVREPQEVRLPGSELVVAMGTLLHRTAAYESATRVLRDDLRRSLGEQLGVPEGASTRQLAETAAARTAADAAEVLDLLAGPTPRTDAEFVALAQRAEAIRHAREVPVAPGAPRADIS